MGFFKSRAEKEAIKNNLEAEKRKNAEAAELIKIAGASSKLKYANEKYGKFVDMFLRDNSGSVYRISGFMLNNKHEVCAKLVTHKTGCNYYIERPLDGMDRDFDSHRSMWLALRQRLEAVGLVITAAE